MATPEELAAGITACIEAGARVINLSLAVVQPSAREERLLCEALDAAAKRGVIVVVAAGNQGAIGNSPITGHPWCIPVVAYDRGSRPTSDSNLGSSIGRRGLGAPGEGITSLGADGEPLMFGGTSAATPFVTGAIALLWSVFPALWPAHLRAAVVHAAGRRRTIVPPLLDAWAAYEAVAGSEEWR